MTRTLSAAVGLTVAVGTVVATSTAAQAHIGPGKSPGIRYSVTAGSGAVHRSLGGVPHRIATLSEGFLPARGCVTFVVTARPSAHMVDDVALTVCRGRPVTSRKATDEDVEGEVF